MPEFLIKPMRRRDEYVLWSTVVDAPTGHGNRASILAELDQRWRQEHPHDDPKPGLAPADRLDRADRSGTSARDGSYGWNDTHLIYQGRGLLARRDLYRAAELLAKGHEAAVTQMLTHFDDDY